MAILPMCWVASSPRWVQRLSRVAGAIDPVAVAHRVAQGGLAGSDVDRIGRRWGHRERADRGHRLGIEYRGPDPAGVDGFPDPAVHVAEVELVGPARHSRDGVHPSSPEWAEEAPAESGVAALQVGGFFEGEEWRNQRERRTELAGAGEEVTTRERHWPRAIGESGVSGLGAWKRKRMGGEPAVRPPAERVGRFGAKLSGAIRP